MFLAQVRRCCAGKARPRSRVAGLAFFTQNRAPGEGAKGEGDVLELHMRALKAVSNATITALPTTALGNGSRALPSSGPVLMGLSVLP